MSVIDDYLATLGGTDKELLEHMYMVVRETVPDTTEETSYAMPSFRYDGSDLVAIMVRGNFISLYPFCSLERLGVDLSAYETTKGSVHFTAKHPISDELLREIITARVRLITA